MNEASQTTLAVIAAIAELRAEGCPVAAPEAMAPIAVRRRFSSGRRGVKPNDLHARIQDLAKGLAGRFEEDPRHVGPRMRDYECERVSKALSGRAAS